MTKTKTTHTQGPWNFIEGDDNEVKTFNIVGPGHSYIAQVDAEDDVDNEDNARLIASAPELLEAAKAMLEAFEMNLSSAGECADKIAAVIKKAEGK